MLIKTAEFVKSSPRLSECPPPKKPEYAFIGRSNVGKSSLINMITGRNKLAKISSKPGKTQLINHFIIDESWYMVDLPGYGWAQVSKKEKARWKVMIEEYLLGRENLFCVFQLIDIRHAPQTIDLEFMTWLGQQQLPFVLVFTKIDKLGKNQVQQNLAAYKRKLLQGWDELPPMILTSSSHSVGGDQIIDLIHQTNHESKWV